MRAEVFRAWITAAATVIGEQRDHLTQLDAAIGDADHGINLDRGFTAVVSAIESAAPVTPGAVLTLTGTTLISKVGGASGPLYGTAFRRAGRALGDAADVDLPGLAVALEDAGYVSTAKNGSGVTARTSVALTGSGRAALERYTTTLRQLLDSASRPQTRDALPNAPA